MAFGNLKKYVQKTKGPGAAAKIPSKGGVASVPMGRLPQKVNVKKKKPVSISM